MKTIAINITENRQFFRFNEEHIVCVLEKNDDQIYVYIMDNNQKTLNYTWCKKATMYEIEKIASDMLYELGYDGKKKEYNPYEGQAYYYLPSSNELELPIDIRYYKDTFDGRLIYGKETIYSANDYNSALKRHQENKDTIEALGVIQFDEIHETIYRLNEYSDGAMSELYYLSEVIHELMQKVDQGFSKDFVEQLNEAYEINKYLRLKILELDRKLPEDLHLEYPVI